MLNRQSQFSSLWLPNLRRLYLVAYASRRFDLPPSKTSRPKYLFAKKILVLSLISSEILRPTFLIVLTWNLHFFGQSWVLSKMTLPIINNIPNAILCDIETIYVQFSENNLQISNVWTLILETKNYRTISSFMWLILMIEIKIRSNRNNNPVIMTNQDRKVFMVNHINPSLYNALVICWYTDR